MPPCCTATRQIRCRMPDCFNRVLLKRNKRLGYDLDTCWSATGAPWKAQRCSWIALLVLSGDLAQSPFFNRNGWLQLRAFHLSRVTRDDRS